MHWTIVYYSEIFLAGKYKREKDEVERVRLVGERERVDKEMDREGEGEKEEARGRERLEREGGGGGGRRREGWSAIRSRRNKIKEGGR